MIEIFKAILVISIEATIAASVIILIKKVFASQISIRISYLLWIPILLRLLIPVFPASPVSIFNFTDLIFESKISAVINPVLNSGIAPLSSSSAQQNDKDMKDVKIINHSTSSSNFSTDLKTLEQPQKNSSENILNIFAYIWACILLIIIAYLICINLLFSTRIKSMKSIAPPNQLIEKLIIATNIHHRIKFVESSEFASPCVFRIIRPIVILPKGFLENTNEKALTHVFAHEFAHIKRFDLFLSWLVSILCTIHWFNPLLWYCLKLIKRDQELCADAYAMSLLSDDDILGYGQTLLSIVKSTNKCPYALMTAGITENKKTLKQRIKNISVFSKNRYRLNLVGILFVLFAGVILCTSQMDYPKDAYAAMQFSDNIMMSFIPNDPNDPRNIDLRIYNNNKIAMNNCDLEIYDGNPYEPESKLLFSSKNFRVSKKKSKTFILKNVDINSAQLKFSYYAGFSFTKSNRGEKSGDIRFWDKTAEINGWLPVSDDEIQSFIKQNKINPVAICKPYDLYTIVVFDNGSASGYYELYKNAKALNELNSRRSWGLSSSNRSLPVQMMGGTASGTYPFIIFKINTPALLSLGDKIEILTNNGVITTQVSGNSIHTVETRGYGSVDKILIYDKDNKLIYDGEKSLIEDVSFSSNDKSYSKVTNEKGFKIVNQSPISSSLEFNGGMFPKEYVLAHQMGNMDWKIPLFTYANTTAYLQAIVESNESPDYFNALIYFVHDIKNKPGNIVSGYKINVNQYNQRSFTNSVIVDKDVVNQTYDTIKNAVSMRSSGPGDQMAVYLKKSMVDKTGGNFTITLDNLNLISYVPSSQYKSIDEQKKKELRNKVFDYIIALGNKEKIISEEVFATVGLKGQKIYDTNLIDISGKYLYCVVFHTEQDALLGPISTFVDPISGKIVGQSLRY